MLLRYLIYKNRKRDDSNIQVHNTIFSKYLALPIATFPINRFFLILFFRLYTGQIVLEPTYSFLTKKFLTIRILTLTLYFIKLSIYLDNLSYRIIKFN